MIRFRVPNTINPKTGRNEFTKTYGKYDNPTDRAVMDAVIAQIQKDIVLGNFDPSLERYFLDPTKHTPVEKLQREINLSLFEQFVLQKEAENPTRRTRYRALYSQVVSSGSKFPQDSQEANAYVQSHGCKSDNLKAIRAFGHWLVANDYRDKDPYRAMVKPATLIDERKLDDDAWSKEECKQILEQCVSRSDKWSLFFAVLLLTGARPSEVASLQREDFDLERGTLCIQRCYPKAKEGYQLKYRLKNGSKNRVVPIQPILKDLISGISKGWLFGETPLDWSSQIGINWRKVLTDAGIEKSRHYRAYNCRHTFTTRALEATNGNVHLVAGWIGDRADVMLKHYAKLIPQSSAVQSIF